MSHFYPQAAVTLRVRWEDFGLESNKVLSKIQELTVLAKRVNVSINDYTQADTFTCDIEYKNFPFDPRTIRALGVTVHIQDMKRLYDTGLVPAEIIPDASNTIFQGFADKESMRFDDSSRIVSFEGRDFTGLLIDSSYDGKALDLGVKLDVLIQQLLDKLPAVSAGKIKIDNRSKTTLPTLGKFAPDFNTFANIRSGKKNETYWDVIQDLAQRAGLICYIELDKLVLTKPRALYDDSKTYQFIYGKNIEDLNFERKLGRSKGLNIVVRSVPVETKEVLEVKIPEAASAEWANSVGVQRIPQEIIKLDAEGKEKKETAPYLSFSIPNIKDSNHLREIGQGIWEELGRQQIEGSFSTKEMCSLQKMEDNESPVEFDITKIKNGTPVTLEIDQGDLEGFNRQKTEQDRERFLKARGYSEAVAKALSVAHGKFKTRYYTKSVDFTLDSSSGFSMNLDFINFIELGNRGL